MGLTYYEIEEARREAEGTINVADHAARGAARIVAGRLRISDVDHETLEKLKRELASYNMHTGRWK